MSISGLNVEVIEKKYNAKYIGDFPTKTNTGWGGAGAVFYQANPDTGKGHTHLFGLFRYPDDTVVIYDASWLEGYVFSGLDIDGEYIWSRDRHDFRQKDGSFVDGGFDYFRAGGDLSKRVNLTIKNGEVVKVTNND